MALTHTRFARQAVPYFVGPDKVVRCVECGDTDGYHAFNCLRADVEQDARAENRE